MKIVINEIVAESSTNSILRCPMCHTPLEFSLDLEQEMDYLEFEKTILLPFGSMKASLYTCTKCNKQYLVMEEDDYDSLVIRNVDILDDNANCIKIMKGG